MRPLRLFLFAVLAMFATLAWADAASDHAKALRKADDKFNAAIAKCEVVKVDADRNKCKGTAKAKHTSAVQAAERAKAKASKS